MSKRALRRWPTDARAARTTRALALAARRGTGCHADASSARSTRHPRELQLRLVAADLLRNAGAAERALTLLEGGLRARAGIRARSCTSIGVLLDGLDRSAEALPYLRDALRARAAVGRRRSATSCRRCCAPARRAEALALVRRAARARFPDDQLLIAYRATALRLLGRCRVSPPLRLRAAGASRIALRPPAPFADIEEFNAAFARELLALHRAAQRPLEQSLRGGTQTERNLPADNPVIAAFFAMLDAPIRDYIARLRDATPEHPIDRRKSARLPDLGLVVGAAAARRFSPGSRASARLAELGVLRGPAGRLGCRRRAAGWLKFGEPGMRVAGCPPEHFVKPAAGNAGAVPVVPVARHRAVRRGGRRLTAAFDVVPA